MAFIPRFKLYASDGTTLLYTFIAVQYTNIPNSIKKNTVIEGIRGNGCIIIPGSNASWDIEIRGILLADDYSTLTDLIDSLESTVVLCTNYVLKFDKDISETYNYNVQRIEPIEYSESLRTNYQEYTVRLKANAW